MKYFESDQYKETEGIDFDKSYLFKFRYQDQTMLHLNDAIETITGYKRLLNQKLSFSSLVHPEDKNRVTKAINNGLAKENLLKLNTD